VTEVESRVAFWGANQPGFRFSSAPVGSREFFEEVERHRYALEPHVPSVVRFEEWAGRDVLEAGCGIATDGLQFARAGARYTGLDFTHEAVELARRRFELYGQEGTFLQGSVTELPFEAESFDLVFSHGVIHHLPETRRAVEEFHRVLRPGGVALVMLYHRSSLNYHLNIMLLRRVLALALLAPGASSAVVRATGERPDVVEGHRELLRTHGARYLLDSSLFLSHNTDGPGNPLSKVYTRSQAKELFSPFARVETAVRFLNLRIWPGGDRLARTPLARRLERRIGWHLYVRAQKAA
jgi:SAM-dependent methyltransferase